MNLLRSVACAVIAACCMAAGYAATTDSGQAERKQAELEQLRSRIQDVRRSMEHDTDRRDTLAQALRSAEREVGKAAQALRDVDGRLHASQQRLDGLQRDRARESSELEADRTALERQIRAAYIAGRQERIKLLLNQEDPVKLGRVLVYYDYLNRARAERIRSIDAHLAKLDTLAEQISTQLAQLTDLRRQRADALARLQQDRDQRAAALAKVKSELASKSRELDKLQQDEKTLADLVASLRAVFADIPDDLGVHQKFSQLKGHLSWPVRGAIAHAYGSARAGGKLTWRGVLIDARPGAEVHAISAGRVAYADWLPHFGLMIIIDHGDGYMSLYGHNQSLFKRAGDWVEPGEVVATVGDSGGQDDAGLYFEIRKGGEPQNPAGWCR